jgi:hypothetical protein
LVLQPDSSRFSHHSLKYFSNQSIDLKRFWRLSVFCGLVTKKLAITAGMRNIERLFFGAYYNILAILLLPKFWLG